MGRHPAVLGRLVVAVCLAGACTDDTSSDPGRVSSTSSTTTAQARAVVVAGPVALAGADSGVDISEVEDQLPVPTGRRSLPSEVGELEVWNDKVVDLPDGRSLVLGRWSRDEALETWSRPRTAEGLAEPVERSDRPIRLFVVDWEAEVVTPISVIPDSHVFSNATGEHLFYETVLEFELEPDGESVRYTAGWNGAGYDSPYSLWSARIPTSS